MISTAVPSTPAPAPTGRPWNHPAATAQAALRRVTSSRARRVFFLLLGVWILNLFDLTLTLRAQADGMLYEGNPIARAILEKNAGVLLAAKLLIVAGATSVLFNFRRFRCAEVACALVLVVYVGVAVQWKLCYDMYDLAHSNTTRNAEIARVDVIAKYLPVL